MDEDKISVSNIPASFLEPYPKNTNLDGDELFLVSQPIKDSDGSLAGYISKSIRYDTFANNISGSLDIAELKARIKKLSDDFNVAETLNYLRDNRGNPYNIPTVLSALRENTRGQIVSVSGYILSDAISNILSNVTLPKINATNSPWVKTTQVTSERGASTSLVASQKLATDIYNDLINRYVHKSDVTSVTGNSTTLVASQKLVSDISAEIQANFVKKTQIKTSIGTSTTDVASQSLVNGLSNIVKTQYLPLTDVVDVLGTDTNKAASQSLVQDLSTHVSQNFLRGGATGNFVLTSNVTSVTGNSQTKVASQALVTNISSNVQEFYNQIQSKIPIGLDGQVYYLTPEGDVKKQMILDVNVYVCENSRDITTSKNAKLSFKDVFNTWERGGVYTRKGTTKWYGYNVGYDEHVIGEGTDGDGPGHLGWKYNDEKSSIEQPLNTTDLSFFASQFMVDKYKVTVRLYSTDTKNQDDDYNGFVAAYGTDSNGKPHILAFIRSTGYFNKFPGLSANWRCIVDSNANNTIGQFLSCGGEYIQDPNPKTGKWYQYNGGTLIQVIRDGNMLTARTTPFSDSVSDNLTGNIIINLDTLRVSGEGATPGTNFDTLKNQLTAFRGPQKIGFASESQASSYYEIIDFDIPKIIIDASKSTDNISSYYNGTMTKMSENAIQYVGVGRLTKNLATNKTFYVTNNGFTKFSEYTA